MINKMDNELKTIRNYIDSDDILLEYINVQKSNDDKMYSVMIDSNITYIEKSKIWGFLDGFVSGFKINTLIKDELLIKILKLIRTMETKFKDKTYILNWNRLPECSVRLRKIIEREALHEAKVYEKEIYLEDVHKEQFLKWQKAGMKSWHEFQDLRGY